MKRVLLRLLNNEIENEVLEFKEAKNSFDKNKLGKYFSALSNEANLNNKQYALLIFGVDDGKNIVGTTINDKTLNEYKLEIYNNTNPSIEFTDIFHIDINDKNVLIFKIPASPNGIPIAWKGHYYGRSGESLVALNLEELERIRSQDNIYDWSKNIIDIASISDLSIEAIQLAKRQFGVKNPHLKNQIESWDNSDFLNKAKITINNKITNTAILLLGKSESEHFISPAVAKISWILTDRDNIERDYEHFSCPFLLNIDKVYHKIRNLKYRYLQDGTLFPDEVDSFEPFIIREALNNCVAHQDYKCGGKINVIENENSTLTFMNSGSFIPKNIENVVQKDMPETYYRNPFLANAMVNLGMIDTIGSGVKKMFITQRDKFFPLPSYSFENNQVVVQIIGKIIDVNYAVRLAQSNDSLTLNEVILLDKVAKSQELNVTEIKLLKNKKLIEGRKPNFHIAAKVAVEVNEKEQYIKNKGFDDIYYEDLIIKYLNKFNFASKKDIKGLLVEKLPDILDEYKKDNKIKNLLQKMKNNKRIKLNNSRLWCLDEI